jgi:hypothetical protein
MAWSDVASDAVKIGLGALVGGFFAIGLARQAHKIRLREEYSRRRRDQLEKISDAFDETSRGILSHITGLYSMVGTQELFADKARVQQVLGFDDNAHQDDLQGYLLKLHSLEARSTLLDVPGVAAGIAKYRAAVLAASIKGSDTQGTLEQNGKVLAGIHDLRAAVINSMSTAYKNA